jgi:hypothetical protein
MIVETATALGQLHGERYPAWMGMMVGDLPVDEKTAQIAGLNYTDAKFWRAQMASFPPFRKGLSETR